MLNNLLLLSGNNIPFEQAQLTIQQPTIKEIGLIGEENFFMGCELLNFSKETLSEEDKIHLENKTNFEVFMSIMNDKNIALRKNKTSVLLVLTILFPSYKILIDKNRIVFINENNEEFYIDNEIKFDAFKKILIEMFCLNRNKDENLDYNPADAAAKKIADKLKAGRQKAAAAKSTGKEKISILNRYVSILAVGLKIDINVLMQYTVFQLFDEFERFELKEAYDMYVKAKMAGAKDVKEVENWMKELHP